MFDRIRKALARDAAAAPAPGDATTSPSLSPVSEWAATQGLGFSQTGQASFGLDGHVQGRPWHLEVGRPSRKYIQGEELRVRAELGVDPDVAVVVMSRPLKELLEKQAYEQYTDALQTTVNSSMPEETRWLAMYDEVGWDSLPRVFWSRYAVLSAAREHALAWIDPELARQLLEWPEPAPGPGLPFMMMMLRGKAYLRMQQGAGDMGTLQHVAQVFTGACENALGAFNLRA